MLGSSYLAPIPPRRSTKVVLSAAIAAIVAIAACAPAASPSSTSGLGSSPDAPRPTSTVAAPLPAPRSDRPFGIPSNAEPLLFGCEGGLPRCTDMAPGMYYTAGTWAFLPGLAFTLPAGWSSLANEAGELELHATVDGTNDIMIWRDVVPWVDGRAAIEMPFDPEAWVRWLQSDPRLVVSDPKRVVIGARIDASVTNGGRNDLEALAVTVQVAPEASNEDADCPGTACVHILMDERHWGAPFSIARDQMDEVGCPCTAGFTFYFGSIGYASHPHLLVVALTAFGPNAEREADMARLQRAAQPILDSLIVPPLIVDN